MKKQFPFFYSDTEYDFEPLWQDAVITFDTNVLLNLYSYKAESKTEWYQALRKLKAEGRLFLPYQVAYEYHYGIAGRRDRSRKTKFATKDLIAELPQFISLLPGESPLRYSNVLEELEKTRDQAQDQISKIVETCEKQLQDQLSKWKSASEADWKSTRDTLEEIFAGTVAEKVTSEKIRQRCLESANRNEQGIPPGFKDKDKQNRSYGNPFADALIWFELKDIVASKKLPLVFVTHDQKLDWWQTSEKPPIPRKELLNEMLVDTGCLFQLATVESFARWMEKTQGATESVAEVKRVEDARFLSYSLTDWAKYASDATINFRTVFSSDSVAQIWHEMDEGDRRELLWEVDRYLFTGRQSELGILYHIKADGMDLFYKIEGKDVIRIYDVRSSWKDIERKSSTETT